MWCHFYHNSSAHFYIIAKFRELFLNINIDKVMKWLREGIHTMSSIFIKSTQIRSSITFLLHNYKKNAK